ncbi:MAG: hypothetical protein PHN72_01890 [Bacilli bacterium]|nr:hypothetical protein [Bacilli bacterium]
MKRLLQIGFDLSLLSFIPVLSWFLLGITIDKNLINIFTLTYPLQFIYYILKSVFSTGANISKEKDKNNNAVMSGIVVGSIISIVIFSIVILNIDNYIHFMNMDISIYKTFTIYSVLQLFLSLEFAMSLNKLYYEEKNELANTYSLIFNLLNFVLLIGTSLITKNQNMIVIITLVPLALFTLFIMIKNSNKFKFKLNIFNCIKYDSVELFNSIAFFLIFLFGLKNALEFGEEYALALTFIALITDTQWDTAEAIVTIAKIDISKNHFNYKIHRRNAYKLIGLVFSTSLIMFGLLYGFYDLDFKLTMIYFSFEIINFIIYPIYKIKTCYLQLEWSAFKMTSNKIISSMLRMIMSLLKNPFCTGIGQVFSSIYQFITVSIFFKSNYTVDKIGNVIPKKKDNA